MYRPTVTALILAFAAIANSWLFITRVLPTLASDTPPGYQSIYASTKDTSTTAWMISLNDSPVGSALSIVEPSPSGTVTVWSNLQLVDLPLNDLLPPWANTLLGAHGGTLHTSIKLEAFGRMTINSRGELRNFQSIVKVPGSLQDCAIAWQNHTWQQSHCIASFWQFAIRNNSLFAGQFINPRRTFTSGDHARDFPRATLDRSYL